MKQYYALLKPASGGCNMRCRYCFYADEMSRRQVSNYGIMSWETAQKVICQGLNGLGAGDLLSFAFQGGEPTLAGLEFFRKFFAEVERLAPSGLRVEYAFQTNGILLDEHWCKLFHNYHVLVGLSMDGPAKYHDQNRESAHGTGTWRQVQTARQLLEQRGVEYNILTVLTNDLARHPLEIWRFLQREKFRYVQFIPCLAELGDNDHGPWALTAERFYQFYAGLFPQWAKSLQKGEYISIKLFDDLANYYLKGIRTACGIDGRCTIQQIIESDGSVYPCDFYVLDQFRLGKIGTDSTADIMAHGVAFLEGSSATTGHPVCTGCPYQGSCNGGCRRMRDQIFLDGSRCWYRRLLDEILRPLLQTAERFIAKAF